MSISRGCSQPLTPAIWRNLLCGTHSFAIVLISTSARQPDSMVHSPSLVGSYPCCSLLLHLCSYSSTLVGTLHSQLLVSPLSLWLVIDFGCHSPLLTWPLIDSPYVWLVLSIHHASHCSSISAASLSLCLALTFLSLTHPTYQPPHLSLFFGFSGSPSLSLNLDFLNHSSHCAASCQVGSSCSNGR